MLSSPASTRTIKRFRSSTTWQTSATASPAEDRGTRRCTGRRWRASEGNEKPFAASPGCKCPGAEPPERLERLRSKRFARKLPKRRTAQSHDGGSVFFLHFKVGLNQKKNPGKTGSASNSKPKHHLYHTELPAPPLSHARGNRLES